LLLLYPKRSILRNDYSINLSDHVCGFAENMTIAVYKKRKTQCFICDDITRYEIRGKEY